MVFANPRSGVASLVSSFSGTSLTNELFWQFESGILAPFRGTDRRSGLIDSISFHPAEKMP